MLKEAEKLVSKDEKEKAKAEAEAKAKEHAQKVADTLAKLKEKMIASEIDLKNTSA